MKKRLLCFGFALVMFLHSPLDCAADETSRVAELDTFWAEVSRSVSEGDFEGYKATCHDKGVLVSGISATSYPLSKALARWKTGFDDTLDGKMKASVAFRFSRRFGDETTAHETGIFLYKTTNEDGVSTEAYIHFEALLIKENGWKTMMEFQKSGASQEEWDALESN